MMGANVTAVTVGFLPESHKHTCSFVKMFSISNYYGSYEELVVDDNRGGVVASAQKSWIEATENHQCCFFVARFEPVKLHLVPASTMDTSHFLN